MYHELRKRGTSGLIATRLQHASKNTNNINYTGQLPKLYVVIQAFEKNEGSAPGRYLGGRLKTVPQPSHRLLIFFTELAINGAREIARSFETPPGTFTAAAVNAWPRADHALPTNRLRRGSCRG
jgi:hypothetical protein